MNKTRTNLYPQVNQQIEEALTHPRNTMFPITYRNMTSILDTSSSLAFERSVEAFPDQWFVNTCPRTKVYEALDGERQYQDAKWGEGKPQSLPGFLLVMQAELDEAIEGWQKNKTGRHAPLNEVVQLAATAVACLERYGTTGSALSTDDIPFPE